MLFARSRPRRTARPGPCAHRERHVHDRARIAPHTRSRMPHPIAEADFACALSTCFWIFPVDVFGTGPKRTSRGTL